jgi:hypothetical protein
VDLSHFEVVDLVHQQDNRGGRWRIGLMAANGRGYMVTLPDDERCPPMIEALSEGSEVIRQHEADAMIAVAKLTLAGPLSNARAVFKELMKRLKVGQP